MGKFNRMSVERQEENLKARIKTLQSRKGWNNKHLDGRGNYNSVKVEFDATMRQVSKWLAEHPERKPDFFGDWYKPTKPRILAGKKKSR